MAENFRGKMAGKDLGGFSPPGKMAPEGGEKFGGGPGEIFLAHKGGEGGRPKKKGWGGRNHPVSGRVSKTPRGGLGRDFNTGGGEQPPVVDRERNKLAGRRKQHPSSGKERS